MSRGDPADIAVHVRVHEVLRRVLYPATLSEFVPIASAHESQRSQVSRSTGFRADPLQSVRQVIRPILVNHGTVQGVAQFDLRGREPPSP
jgi:hypothetical protein